MKGYIGRGATRYPLLEIADAIERNANTSDRDLEELFRRLVFSILSSNTDDHVRNHGFLRRGPGWDLSPAYDMNPNPFSAGSLSLAVDLEDPTASIESALSVATAFRLSAERGRAIVAEVESATRSWREVATGMGIPAREIAIMGAAFEGSARTIARRWSAPATGIDLDLEDLVVGAGGGPTPALPTAHTASPDRRTQNRVCGAWMPRARARCVLPPHPTGHHRSVG